jgi:hypothetical protein
MQTNSSSMADKEASLGTVPGKKSWTEHETETIEIDASVTPALSIVFLVCDI